MWTLLAALVLASPARAPVAKAPPDTGGTRQALAPSAAERPARGMPNIVYLASIDGLLPTDSLDRRAFVGGVLAAFAADRYRTERPSERPGPGPLALSLPLANHFQLVRGDPFGDEWQVRITIMAWLSSQAVASQDGRSVPSRAKGGDSIRSDLGDSLRGLRVNIVVLSAEAAAAGARPLPVREDLVLSMPVEPRAAWFSHAGRMAGLLAVEELHHQSDDLAADTRVRLDQTVRTSVIARRPPAPSR